jgi:hypothetical protein
VFGSVEAKSGALGHAIRLLLLAAETGKGADIETATDQIERVLRARGHFGFPWPPKRPPLLTRPLVPN